MAQREIIDKAQVQSARESILARGERATINAVRSELGNKGSKTTIVRLLRELNAQDELQSQPNPDGKQPQSNDNLIRMTVLARAAIELAEEQNLLRAQWKKLAKQKMVDMECLVQQLDSRDTNTQTKYLQLRYEASALLVRDAEQDILGSGTDYTQILQSLAVANIDRRVQGAVDMPHDQQNDQVQATLMKTEAALRQITDHLANLHRQSEGSRA